MEKFALVSASGLVSGMVYAMLAIAFVLLYRASGVVNIAIGEIVTVGALVTYSMRADHGLALVVAGGMAVAIGAVISGTITTTLLRPAHGRLDLSLMLTFGAALVVQAIARLVWGATQYSSAPYTGVPRSLRLGIGDATVNDQALYLLGAVIVVYGGSWWLIEHTSFGRSLRATAADREVASAYGIRTGRIMLATSLLAGGIAALAGFVLLPIVAFTYTGGTFLAVKGLIAWIAGGLNRLSGALAGGLALGVAEALVGGYLVSGWQNTIVFGALIGLLLVRPQGLFGKPIAAGVR